MAAPATKLNDRRMSLAAVKAGTERRADKILLLGVEGVGKSTFAADAPAPIFIPVEDGIAHLDVARFPVPETFEDVMDAIRELGASAHEYKTAVLDTVDAVEPLIWASLCKSYGWENIEAPGYGKGYVAALGEWRKLIVEIDRLRAAKGMEIILIAHAQIKNFSNPLGNDYMRYAPKLNDKAGALLKEWAEAALFAHYEEYGKKEKGAMQAKGVSTGRRVIHTNRTAAWDAKNRHNLPDELPLSYADYATARDANAPANADDLFREAIQLAESIKVPAPKLAVIQGEIAKNKTNPARMAKIVDRLRSLAAETEGESA